MCKSKLIYIKEMAWTSDEVILNMEFSAADVNSSLPPPKAS